MKTKWNNQQIKEMFDFIATDLKQNLPLMQSFKKFAKKTGKNALSIRNLYYFQLKKLNENKNLAKNLGIDLNLHKVNNFSHFDKNQEIDLKNRIDFFIKKGYSVRKACATLSDGNIQEMLRLQNKYHTIKKKEILQNKTNKVDDCKIIKFPIAKTLPKKQTLTDDELKSLFMGLVKLVKEMQTKTAIKTCNCFWNKPKCKNAKKLSC